MVAVSIHSKGSALLKNTMLQAAIAMKKAAIALSL